MGQCYIFKQDLGETKFMCVILLTGTCKLMKAKITKCITEMKFDYVMHMNEVRAQRTSLPEVNLIFYASFNF